MRRTLAVATLALGLFAFGCDDDDDGPKPGDAGRPEAGAEVSPSPDTAADTPRPDTGTPDGGADTARPDGGDAAGDTGLVDVSTDLLGS